MSVRRPASQPGPFMAVYYATKAFVNSFSEALSEELVGTGITVTCLAQGRTESEFGMIAGIASVPQASGIADARTVARPAFGR